MEEKAYSEMATTTTAGSPPLLEPQRHRPQPAEKEHDAMMNPHHYNNKNLVENDDDDEEEEDGTVATATSISPESGASSMTSAAAAVAPQTSFSASSSSLLHPHKNNNNDSASDHQHRNNNNNHKASVSSPLSSSPHRHYHYCQLQNLPSTILEERTSASTATAAGGAGAGAGSNSDIRLLTEENTSTNPNDNEDDDYDYCNPPPPHQQQSQPSAYPGFPFLPAEPSAVTNTTPSDDPTVSMTGLRQRRAAALTNQEETTTTSSWNPREEDSSPSNQHSAAATTTSTTAAADYFVPQYTVTFLLEEVSRRLPLFGLSHHVGRRRRRQPPAVSQLNSSSSNNNQYKQKKKDDDYNDTNATITTDDMVDDDHSSSYSSSPMTAATWIGFWALFHVTCANYVLTPMRDAIALTVGVKAMPQLTLASTVLAFGSSVPIGWLFEAPDPNRRLVWKRMGLTRGETQGSSLALFYRCFALILLSYAIGFPLLEFLYQQYHQDDGTDNTEIHSSSSNTLWSWSSLWNQPPPIATWIALIRQGLYIAFFLVVHLMKLHSLSLVWGVTTEAMEYEEGARQRQERDRQQEQEDTNTTNNNNNNTATRNRTTTTRLQRLGLIGFGGTLGGILGSILASSLAQVLYLPGLLLVAALLLEVSAELSIELGRIMQKHWVEQQQQELFQLLLLQQQQQSAGTSSPSLSMTPSSSSASGSASSSSSASSSHHSLTAAELDTSIRRTVSLGSMKRVASGNSLNRAARSATDLKSLSTPGTPGTNQNNHSSSAAASSSSSLPDSQSTTTTTTNNSNASAAAGAGPTDATAIVNDDTFFQRLFRGVTTILRSRLLMAIFTYNALYASTTVLLSFQRASLVANRHEQSSSTLSSSSNTEADLAFLARINIASSVAIFALQASGTGASLAQLCGPRGTLALMPLIRLLGVLALAWWHHTSRGQPPNLLLFLMLDECCKIMNLAVAKPVRESLWRGLSNEARYEAKPIVDTLANRWGGGSAAFLVSTLEKLLDAFMGATSATARRLGDADDMNDTSSHSPTRLVLGCPPLLFLCIVISAWWAVVSIDLGHIRRTIDLELKKRQ